MVSCLITLHLAVLLSRLLELLSLYDYLQRPLPNMRPENETRLAATCYNTLQSVTASNALAEREKLVVALRL